MLTIICLVFFKGYPDVVVQLMSAVPITVIVTEVKNFSALTSFIPPLVLIVAAEKQVEWWNRER